MKIAVLVPCYNEELTIGKVVDDFKRELPEADIYVYDNEYSYDDDAIDEFISRNISYVTKLYNENCAEIRTGDVEKRKSSYTLVGNVN